MKRLLNALVLCMLPCAVNALEAPTPEVLWEIGAAADAERLREDVAKLVSFGTRHSLSETESSTRGIGAARRWIMAEFGRISAKCGDCLEVIVQRDVVSGTLRIPVETEIVNVIAVLRGTTEPNRFVMMSGDIDRRRSSTWVK